MFNHTNTNSVENTSYNEIYVKPNKSLSPLKQYTLECEATDECYLSNILRVNLI